MRFHPFTRRRPKDDNLCVDVVCSTTKMTPFGSSRGPPFFLVWTMTCHTSTGSSWIGWYTSSFLRIQRWVIVQYKDLVYDRDGKTGTFFSKALFLGVRSLLQSNHVIRKESRDVINVCDNWGSNNNNQEVYVVKRKRDACNGALRPDDLWIWL